MLEKMDEFFAARVAGYDEHMLSEIEGSKEFYPYTASLLPGHEGARVLDLGCGTGIELKRGYKEIEYNIIETDNGDCLCVDVMRLEKKGWLEKLCKVIWMQYLNCICFCTKTASLKKMSI